MQKAFGAAPSLAPASSTKKAAARAALVDLKESSRFLLTECFRQFGIEAVVTKKSLGFHSTQTLTPAAAWSRRSRCKTARSS